MGSAKYSHNYKHNYKQQSRHHIKNIHQEIHGSHIIMCDNFYDLYESSHRIYESSLIESMRV